MIFGEHIFSAKLTQVRVAINGELQSINPASVGMAEQVRTNQFIDDDTDKDGFIVISTNKYNQVTCRNLRTGFEIVRYIKDFKKNYIFNQKLTDEQTIKDIIE